MATGNSSRVLQGFHFSSGKWGGNEGMLERGNREGGEQKERQRGGEKEERKG